MRRVRWRGDDVEEHDCSVDEGRAIIPAFSRRPFAVSGSDRDKQAVNLFRDLIVRTNDNVPVGVVSKQYRLVQHTEVFDLAIKALKEADVDLTEVVCHLAVTRYGERMALGIRLPDKYGLDRDDGHPMSLQLHCFNSVDGR